MTDVQQEALAVLTDVWTLSPDVRLGQLMAHQQRSGRQALSFLEQRQRLQQVIGRRRAVAFGNPLEKHERSIGSLIQKSRGGGERQDTRISGASANRRFGEFQEPGVALRIVKIP